MASTVATASSGGCAIQDVLDAQVDFVAGGISSNLDAISKRGQGSVRPATSAVLGDVLVQGMSSVTLSINVTPVPVVLSYYPTEYQSRRNQMPIEEKLESAVRAMRK